MLSGDKQLGKCILNTHASATTDNFNIPSMPGLLGSVYNRMICVEGGIFCERMCAMCVRVREGDSWGDTGPYSYIGSAFASSCSFPVTSKSPDLKRQALCSRWKLSQCCQRSDYEELEQCVNEEGSGVNVAREKEVYSRETTVRRKKVREGGYSVGCGADLLSREAVGRCEHRGGTRIEMLVNSITDLRV